MKQTVLYVVACGLSLSVYGQVDPGPRRGPTTAGKSVAGATVGEMLIFEEGKDAFNEVDNVVNGLGPRFNLDGCAGCHAQPTVGGSAPAVNPQIAAGLKWGAVNRIPPFIRPDGPAMAVRFKQKPDGTPDGGVHSLFVITGRADAPAGCNIQQEDFSRRDNLTFRIPTPLFGLGLIESISDDGLRANLAFNSNRKLGMGIRGRFNTNGNDGTITRFGWKAQNKSLMIFSGEAYNVEVGVTNELFPNERDGNKVCTSAKASPEDHADLERRDYSDVEKFAVFMRYLDGPPAAATNPSVDRGRSIFDSTGCTLCHTPQLKTDVVTSAALSQKSVNLYSDLALHRMGTGLNDGISQGDAQPDEFRTAPLWGIGERLFLLHDGRSRDLMDAIRQHDGPGSEAHNVIRSFDLLTREQKQDLLNFLRSL